MNVKDVEKVCRGDGTGGRGRVHAGRGLRMRF